MSILPPPLHFVGADIIRPDNTAHCSLFLLLCAPCGRSKPLPYISSEFAVYR